MTLTLRTVRTPVAGLASLVVPALLVLILAIAVVVGEVAPRAICIVGAGPAGTQLYALLASKGVDVVLIEKRSLGSTRWHDSAHPVSRTLRSVWRAPSAADTEASMERQDFASIFASAPERRFHVGAQGESVSMRRSPIAQKWC